jgi:hypothetical protein
MIQHTQINFGPLKSMHPNLAADLFDEFFTMYKFETKHFKPVYFRGKNNIFGDLQNFKPAKKMDPANCKKDRVRKSQILKLPHFCRKFATSVSPQI